MAAPSVSGGITVLETCDTGSSGKSPIAPPSGATMTTANSLVGGYGDGINNTGSGVLNNNADGSYNPQTGVYLLSSAVDLTVDKRLFVGHTTTPAGISGFSKSTGSFLVLYSGNSGTEEAAFTMAGIERLNLIQSGGIVNANKSTNAHIYTGAFDPSNVTHVGASFTGRAYINNKIDTFGYIDPAKCINGTVSDKGNIQTFITHFDDNDAILNESPTTNMHHVLFSWGAGDGSTLTHFAETLKVFEFAQDYNLAEDWGRARLNDNDLGYETNASASDGIAFELCNWISNTPFYWNSIGSTSATVSYTSCVIQNAGDLTVVNGHTFDGCLFDGCAEISATAPTFTNTTLKNAPGAALSVGAAGAANMTGVTFSNNQTALKVDVAGSTTLDVTEITFDSSNTYYIEYTGTGTLTVTSPTSIASGKLNASGGGTITVVSPTADLTVNSSESASQINVFTTTTQTIIDTEASASQLVYTHSNETVDITVLKDGFIPFRQTGVVLSGNTTIDVQLVASREYDSSHGLTYTTDASWASNQLTVPTWGVTGQGVFSLIMEAFKSQTALRNTDFNLQMDGAGSLYLVDDAEGATDGDIENFIECGVAYLDTSGTTTASWVGVKSVGTATGFTGEFQQVDGSGTTNARTTGIFNEVVKTYGDATHGNFDYTDHLVLKYQPNGYRETRVDVLDSYGISALSPTLYIVAMQPVAIAAATGDPAVTITVTDHGASPVSWNSKDWSITVVDSGTVSGEDILRELNYNLSLDATYQGKDPFNWPEMVLEAGSAYETGRGITEGGTGATLKGVRILRGSSEHPDFSRMQSDDGTYWAPTAAFDFTIDNLETGSQVVLYETGTQTIVDSTASSGTSYNYTGTYTADQVVDYTIIKVGFAPIRVVGVTISSSPITQSAIMVEDRVYVASSGLVFGSTATVNTTTKIFGLTTGSTVQNYYSFMVESWRDETALRNKAFPLSTNGPNSVSLNDGYEFNSSSDIDNLSRDGMRYVDSSGTTTASWCAVFSQGDMTGLQAEYQQVDGSSTTDTLSTGVVDQLLQIYGDASHGNFDYTGHLVVKCQSNGYRQARVDVVDVYGTLEDQLYVVSLAPETISDLTLGDPVASGITITDHGASPVTWNGKQFSITITDSGANSGEVLLRELNYNLSLDAAYQGKEPFNWGEMVVEAGSNYESLRGELEGDTGADLKGVRVVRGTDPHPDFTRMQADDGTYYTVPVTANISISNLPDDVGGDTHLQIYNVTTSTLIYSGDPAGTSYSDSYTNGDAAYASSGHDVRIRFAHTNAGTTFELGQTTVTATTDGITANGDNFIAADSVYATNGIDGSTITKFSYTPVNDQFNLIISSNFTAAEMYAFYCYTLTTTDGIEGAYGAFEASDAGNYKNITAITSIYLDNETTASKRQTDTARIYRDDGAYPVLDPTTSGFGIDINWQNVVYVVTAGSGLTAPQAAELTTAASVKTDTNQLTFTKTNELDINVQSVNGTSIAGSGTELDPWGP